MKEIINVYKANRQFVENFVQNSVQRIELEYIDRERADSIFSVLNSAALIYFVDDEFMLRSPYFYKNKSDNTQIGSLKNYYFTKINFTDNSTFLSNPYISSRTGKTNITYVRKVDGGYTVIDFNLLSIMQRLGLVQSSKTASFINKFVYGFMGFSLLFFAVFLGFYAIYVFIESVILSEHFNLDSTFKAIIALTLGLAIYDLARTILEQEIFFKTVATDKDEENIVLSKFLISIIIALSIESLMVVFKITINDYTDLMHAFFLIVGVSFMIYALGKYNYFSHMKECN